MYTVYMHRNKVNGKKYIGLTRCPLHRRWRKGIGYKSQPAMWNAIQTYGWESFEHLILAEGLSQSEAKEFEVFYIALYETTNPKFGYNITFGGESASGRTVSDELRERIRQTLIGRPHTEERKLNMSKSLKGKKHNLSDEMRQFRSERMVGNQFAKGYRYTDEQRESYRTAMRERLNSPKIRCVETGVIYVNTADAARLSGVNSGSIYECCEGKGRRKSAGGFHWEYMIEKVG